MGSCPSRCSDKFGLQPNFQLQAAAAVVSPTSPIVNNHPVLVRTGTGDFYEDLAFRFTGPVQLARDGRLGDRLIKTDYNNFAPRLGIAYSPSAKWSFRTGFGVFFSQESKNSIFDMSRAAGGRANPAIDQQGVPTLTFQQLHQHQPIAGVVRARTDLGRRLQSAATLTRCSICSTFRERSGNNSTLEVGYTGNQSRKVALPGQRQCSAARDHPVRRARALSGMARHPVSSSATESATTTRSAAS